MERDELLTIAEVARRFPGAGGAKSINTATITRWITRGVRHHSGEMVRLRAVRVGARWLVTESALATFVGTLTADTQTQTTTN